MPSKDIIIRDHSASPCNHLWRELSLLLGDGGCEGRAFSDPVRLDSPEIHLNMCRKVICLVISHCII